MTHYVMDFETQMDLLECARRIQLECARLGCSEPRTALEGYLPPDHPGRFCEAHGDAL